MQQVQRLAIWKGPTTTYLVMLHTRHTVLRDRSPLPVRANPQLGVHLVLGDDLACEDMTHEQVVVHRLRNDLRDRRGVELNEGVVF